MATGSLRSQLKEAGKKALHGATTLLEYSCPCCGTKAGRRWSRNAPYLGGLTYLRMPATLLGT